MHDWLLAQQGWPIYGAFVLLLLGGSVGLPIPEDMPLLFMGAAIHHDAASWQVTIVVGYFTILLSDGIIFWVGKRFGPRLFRSRLLGSRFPPERMEAIHLRIDRHAFLMIFLARHLFYLRTATFLSCGAFGMRFGRFIVADACAALISVPLLLGLGFLGAEHLPSIIAWVQTVKYASIPFGLALLAAAWWIIKVKERSARDESEPPASL
jgi:membrane protein DedA with SNARE-associated domain